MQTVRKIMKFCYFSSQRFSTNVSNLFPNDTLNVFKISKEKILKFYIVICFRQILFKILKFFYELRFAQS